MSSRPQWYQLPDAPLDTRVEADYRHAERMEYEARIARLERMVAWHVQVRQSQEKFIQALFANCQFYEASNAYWRERATNLSEPTERNVERKAAS